MHSEVPPSSARVPAVCSPVLSRLRVETAEYHAMLEALLPLRETQPSPTTAHGLFLRFWGFYAPIAQRLLRGPRRPQSGVDYRERLKTPKLEPDLYDAGESADTLLRAPQRDDLPPVSPPPQMLGGLYVIEGAMLGGQSIARQRQVSLGSTPDCGARFFNGSGSETGIHWKATGAFPTAPWTDGAYSLTRHGVTLAHCDSEPVQTPGCRQAHGVVLVLRVSDLTILQVSANSVQHLGLPPHELLGQSIA